jgi:hypothetical protein
MGDHASAAEEIPALIQVTDWMTPKEREDAEAHNMAVTRLIERLEDIKRNRGLTQEELLCAWR